MGSKVLSTCFYVVAGGAGAGAAGGRWAVRRAAEALIEPSEPAPSRAGNCVPCPSEKLPPGPPTSTQQGSSSSSSSCSVTSSTTCCRPAAAAAGAAHCRSVAPGAARTVKAARRPSASRPSCAAMEESRPPDRMTQALRRQRFWGSGAERGGDRGSRRLGGCRGPASAAGHFSRCPGRRVIRCALGGASS